MNIAETEPWAAIHSYWSKWEGTGLQKAAKETAKDRMAKGKVHDNKAVASRPKACSCPELKEIVHSILLEQYRVLSIAPATVAPATFRRDPDPPVRQ